MARPRHPIAWDEFDKLCALQCTLREISSWFKCSEDTIEAACKREKKMRFAEYYEQKSGAGKISLRRRQYKAAESGNVTMLIWLGKQWLGQRDKHDTEVSGKDGGTIKLESKFSELSDADLLAKSKEALKLLGGVE